MRFLCCFQHKDNNDTIVKKCEVHETKVDDVEKGRTQLLVKLSIDYDIPAEFIDREEDESKVVGIFYIEPKKEYKSTDLNELDVEPWEEYNKDNIW